MVTRKPSRMNEQGTLTAGNGPKVPEVPEVESNAKGEWRWGSSKDPAITPEDLGEIADHYYAVRGWDAKNRRTPETLQKLELPPG